MYIFKITLPIDTANIQEKLNGVVTYETPFMLTIIIIIQQMIIMQNWTKKDIAKNIH